MHSKRGFSTLKTQKKFPIVGGGYRTLPPDVQYIT